MPTKVLEVPATKLGSHYWFLLGYFGKRHAIRFLKYKPPKRGRDPSDHRLFEMTIEGSVKWLPKDPAKLNIKEVPALGAR